MRDIVKRQVEFGENPKYYYEFFGLSTETKPTEDVATGSQFTELDTATVFGFEESTINWYPEINLGGGS